MCRVNSGGLLEGGISIEIIGTAITALVYLALAIILAGHAVIAVSKAILNYMVIAAVLIGVTVPCIMLAIHLIG